MNIEGATSNGDDIDTSINDFDANKVQDGGVGSAPPSLLPEKKSSKSEKARGIFLFSILAFEIFIFILLIARFSNPANQNIMLLETSIEKGQFVDPDDFTLEKYDILDTITLLTGTELDGRATENSLRKLMSYDSGQAMWIILEDLVKEKDDILVYAKNNLAEEDYQEFEKKILKDEIINIIYGMGGSEDSFRNNWKTVGVNELKLAPFLPWKKKIDFVILSFIDEKHVGGLEYVLSYNPGIPVLCPPLTKKSYLKSIRALERAHNLIPIMPGYTMLTSRLGTYVSVIKPSKTSDPMYELDLVIQLKDGVAIVAGEGMMGPLKLVKDVQEVTGKKVKYYIGGTNLNIGLETDVVNNELKQLKRIAPEMEIYPNYNTSIIGRQMIAKVFGDKYHSTPLGLKVRFSK